MKTQTDTFSETSKIEFFQEHGELPIEYLREYDGAAEHFAKQGKLPDLMGSPGAIDYINADPEAFDQRVNDFKYAIAMEHTNASHLNKAEATTAETSQQGEDIHIDQCEEWQRRSEEQGAE